MDPRPHRGGEDGHQGIHVSAHTRTVAQALFVTLLWSSSYVLIKIGLATIPPVTFAGLRYGLAGAVLLPLFVYRGHHRSIRALGGRDLGLLVVLGLLLYAVTQGAQFVALLHIRAASVSLILSFTPAVVALLAVPVLGEGPSIRQVGWIGVVLVGVGGYFYPFDFRTAALLGLGIIGCGLVANALSAILGRRFNRAGSLSPLAVTTVSMCVGAAVLLVAGLAVQGLPRLGPASWGIIVWLAVVNTAFAFTLWNRTLQTLTATESSVINNTMLAQIAVLEWVVLGESFGPTELLGVVLVMVGAMGVQLAD